MVAAGLIVDLLFSALHLVPTGPRPPSALAHAHFAWDYSTWLDILAISIVAVLAVVRFRGSASQELHGSHSEAACEHRGMQ